MFDICGVCLGDGTSCLDCEGTPHGTAVCECGDGIVEGDELCDAGDLNGTTASCCTVDCALAAEGTECSNDTAAGSCDATGSCIVDPCGDGIIEGDEQCDAGDLNGLAQSCCTAECTLAAVGAECSNGTVPGSCSDTGSCIVDACGDGIAEGTEQCDDGDLNGTTASCCTVDCALAVEGTECSNDTAAGSCDAAGSCIVATCGDGIVEGTEQCDDGAPNGTADSCCTAECVLADAGTDCNVGTMAGSCNLSGSCVFIDSCGDGIVEGTEQCDDGDLNGTTASCCSVACTIAATSSTCNIAGVGGFCDISGTCVIEVNELNPLARAVIAGTEDVTIGRGSTIKGSVFLEKPDADLVIGRDSRMDGADHPSGLSADKIILGSDGNFEGHFAYNDLTVGSNTTLVGTETSPVTLPALTLPAYATATPGTQTKVVGSGQTLNLPGGDYGFLIANGTVVLGGTLYNFQQIILGSGARIEATMPVDIRVAQNVQAGQDAFIGADPDTGLSARDMMIEIGGYLMMGERATVYANIHAWEKIIFGEGTKATGAFITKHFVGGKFSEFILDSAYGFMCLDDSACPAGQLCFEGMCVSAGCLVDADCSGNGECLGGLCQCNPGFGGPHCSEAVPEDCQDGADNDGDGAIDCADADCFAHAACP